MAPLGTTLRALFVPRRVVTTLRVGVALAALALILIPAEAWAQREFDLQAEGFDANTMYRDEAAERYAGNDRFEILTNGEWEPCPCEAGDQIVLAGKNNLVDETFADPLGAFSLGDVSVWVDGTPAAVYLVTPRQINFELGPEVTPPGAAISVRRGGEEVAHQYVAISGATGTEEARESSITPDRLELYAVPGTQPGVHLFTTPRSFRTSFDVTVKSSGGGEPFEAMIWNPRTFGAIAIEFGPPPERAITAVVRSGKADVRSRRSLGNYEEGAAYNITIARPDAERIELSIGASGAARGDTRRLTFDPDDAPEIFEGYRPSVSVLSQSEGAASHVVLRNYRLEMPHERFLSVRVDDGRIVPIAVALVVAAFALHLTIIIRTARAMRRALPPLSPRSMGRALVVHWKVAVAAVVIVAALAFVLPAGSHLFDMQSQKVWTYLLVHEPPGDIYYRAQTVPLASIWNGVPYHEAVYPYGVSMAYYFYAIGSLYELGGGSATPDSLGLEVAIKVANLAVAVADAALIFALARSYGRRGLAWLAPVAFLLNPAMLFDLAVWGETESVALFFLLASMLAARHDRSRLAWALLALAFLGKQTVVVPAVLVAVYYLRLFPLRRNLDGIVLGAPVAIAAILPFLIAGYSPSIAIDPILGAFNVFGGSESEQVFQVVAYDSYSIWPLVTLLRHDRHGMARLQFPDYNQDLGPLTYQQAGVLTFFTVFAALILFLLLSKRVKSEPGLIFIVLAFAMVAELTLPTRSIARYLVFPVVFAIIASADMPRRRSLWFVIAAVTTTSLVGMYGSVAAGLEYVPDLAPRLAPGGNVASQLALDLFRNDLMITVGSVLNIAALIVLGLNIWLPGGLRLPAMSWLPRITIEGPERRSLGRQESGGAQ